MSRDPSLPPEPLPLTEASVQEIQLELLRRQRFNFCDGPKIVASLRRHRKLWRAVIMDRLGSPLELIKLRDLDRNAWNVDHLYILADTREQVHALERLAEEEDWKADNVQVLESRDERVRALGTTEPGFVISFWWD